MSNNYFALTIGPIYETLKRARKTRDLWASSYMFSYLIKMIAKRIFDEVGDENYLMPHLGADPHNGAGLYPDRIIAIIPNDKKFDDLKAIAEDTINEFSKKVAVHLRKDVTKISDYVRSYIRYPSISPGLDTGKNIILDIYPYLDNLELTPKIPLKEENEVEAFIRNANDSFLTEDGFGSARKHIRFESILEVSAKTLDYNEHAEFEKVFKKYDNPGNKAEIDENELIKDLKNKFTNDYRPHQKYIAIVNADGDSIGKAITQIAHKPELVKIFSEFLFGFASSATDIVKEYGGLPIYMGGDDMLFFAPVAVADNSKVEGSKFQTIFSLVDSLDKLFNDEFEKFVNTLKAKQEPIEFPTPTLSYGISVTYYKYPLYEALHLSHTNLWEKAKNEALHPGKNTISFSLQKHSGQLIEADFEKGELYGDIKKFINDLVKQDAGEDNNYLNSLTHRLEFYEPLFEAAIEEGITDFKNFFDNSFNEDEHIEKNDFLEALAVITGKVNQSGFNNKTALLYATLRFIHFINAKKDE